MPSKRIGNRLEDYVQSKEPPTRSGMLLHESAKRLRIGHDDVHEIIKPYSVFIQRLPVSMLGEVVNLMSGIVLHNRARGPYKGGIRIAPDVSLWETTELARLMTLKTALAGCQLGGGKSGISVDMRALYKHMVRSKRFHGDFREFARVAKGHIIQEFSIHFGWLFKEHLYIPAPDMGSGPEEMVFIYNDTHDAAAVTGKAEGIEGWLPGRREATGYGVFYSMLKDMEDLGKAPADCTVAIQGFGNVGSYAAQFLVETGARVVGVTDMFGGAYDPDGLDIAALSDHTAKTGGVKGFTKKSLTNEELFKLKVDYLMPAAAGHVIDGANAKAVGAHTVVEAANMPVTYDGMQLLDQRKVRVIPDVYANAGGVIASEIEYRHALGGDRCSYERTLERIRETFDDMREAMAPHIKRGRTMLQASTDIALERVHKTMLQRSLL